MEDLEFQIIEEEMKEEEEKEEEEKEGDDENFSKSKSLKFLTENIVVEKIGNWFSDKFENSNFNVKLICNIIAYLNIILEKNF
jgi:hypothetical protein